MTFICDSSGNVLVYPPCRNSHLHWLLLASSNIKLSHQYNFLTKPSRWNLILPFVVDLLIAIVTSSNDARNIHLLGYSPGVLGDGSSTVGYRSKAPVWVWGWTEKLEKRRIDWHKHKEVKLVQEVKQEVCSRDKSRHRLTKNKCKNTAVYTNVNVSE